MVKELIKQSVSAENCQAIGITGAWDEFITLALRHGHGEDPQLKGAFSLITGGFKLRAKCILHARECLK